MTRVWSRGGVASSVCVDGFVEEIGKGFTKRKDEMFLFDCGYLDEVTKEAKHVFITHGHTDHIAALISHARCASQRGSNVKYYVPKACVDSINKIREAFQVMDGSEISMNLIGVDPGEEITFGENSRFKIVVFKTDHRCPSQGYAIQRIHDKVLKKQFQEMVNKYAQENLEEGGEKKLKQLRGKKRYELTKEYEEQNIDIFDHPQPTTEFVYTGDTRLTSLMEDSQLGFIFSAEIFVTESTYIEFEVDKMEKAEKEKAEKYAHTHINDFLEPLKKESEMRNEDKSGDKNAYESEEKRDLKKILEKINLIVLVHIGNRYPNANHVLRILRKRLGDLTPKFAVALKAFGRWEDLTFLGDVTENESRNIGNGGRGYNGGQGRGSRSPPRGGGGRNIGRGRGGNTK